MVSFVALVMTVAVLCGAADVVSAQPAQGGRAVFDALNEVLGVNWHAHGHVVQHREGTLVLRGDDRRVYTINTAGLDTGALRRLKDGQPVSIELKRPTKADAMPIAASVETGEGSAKRFRRVEGIVEAVSDEQIAFTTREGMRLTLDRARLVGEVPDVAVNETATLIYEQEPALAGVWIETRDSQPSALTGPGRR